MQEVIFGSVISVFELLVYVTVGCIGLSYIFLLFGIENFIITNSFAYSITFFAMSYCLGFILHYIGIKIYKILPHKNFIETLLDKNKTCMFNYFDKCREIAIAKYGYTDNEGNNYSKRLYYNMRYNIAKRYSWNNFAEYANIYHYFALSLLALTLTLIPITTYRIINTCICRHVDWYLFYILASAVFSVLLLKIAEYFEKIHVRRVVSTYLNMGRNKE